MKLPRNHPDYMKEYRKTPQYQAWYDNYYPSYYQAHKEDYRRRKDEWVRNNPEKARKMWDEGNARRKPQREAARLLKRHGMTWDEYYALLNSQGGLCAICGKDLSNARRSVDHCHERGHTRGILCGPCNTGIGLLRHDPQILVNAISYLCDHQEPKKAAA